jgi:MFS family permease
MSPFARFLNRLQGYPRQFWLLFLGMALSTTGASMIWPFLTIYVGARLNLPLATTALLFTVNAVMGLIFAFVAGPITDFLGRKWVMVFSLVANGLVYLVLSRADSFAAFAVLMGLSGAVNPLYRIGADAMMADLIPSPRRPEAYSLLRMSSNIGVAVGPAIGGLIAASSYTYAFISAAGGMLAYGLLIALFAAETLPARLSLAARLSEPFGGYDRVLRDRPFVSFTASFALTMVCAATMFILLGAYAKQHFGLPENRFGLIPTTNALMVIFLQFAVTQFTRRHRPLPVLGFGALFYACGVGSVALGQGFWAFWASMVVLTIGELIMTPTATTLAADLAPAEMRGRYMSIYGLTWGVAAGIGPVLGGLLNDRLGPQYPWVGAFLIGLLSAAGFFLQARRPPQPQGQTTISLPT